ncbi:MAG TPA: DMT family transporter [Phycisphaerales bacterium]|nr:DMT family transporter [Phycisphaerales bacterium]
MSRDRRCCKEGDEKMRAHLYVLTLFLGVVLAVHLAMNGKVGSVLNNPRVGNAVFWCIGAVMAVIIGLTGWKTGALAPLRQVHPILLTAGALGACLVFAIAWLIPQIGAGPVMITLLAGQVIGGIIMSHFGWLGSPVQPVSVMKIVGVLIMVGGVALATFGK